MNRHEAARIARLLIEGWEPIACASPWVDDPADPRQLGPAVGAADPSDGVESPLALGEDERTPPGGAHVEAVTNREADSA